MKRVLVLAGWYPPCDRWPTAARRAATLVHGLPQHGWAPTVILPDLTNGLCSCEPCRRGIAPERYDGVSALRTVVRPTAVRRLLSLGGAWSRSAPDSVAAGPIAGPGLTRRILQDCREFAWSRNATQTTWGRSAARAGRSVLAATRFDAVFSTSGPFEHIRAARLLAKSASVPWIADLRDPATIDVTAEGRWIEPLVRLGRVPSVRALRNASILVSPTQQVIDVDRGELGKVELVLPGFDAAEWSRARANARRSCSHVEILFAGRLYPEYRRPDVFLRGLRIAASELPEGAVRLVYYGRDGADLVRAAEFEGCAALVDDRGFVAPDRMPELIASASGLLLLTNEVGASGVPGGKFYEYLAAHRPILAVPDVDSFVREVLSRTGAGEAASNAEEVAAVVLRWVSEQQETGDVRFDGDRAVIDEYSDIWSVRRLAELLNAASQAGDRS